MAAKDYFCEPVCVEPPSSALNVTLPAFAAERQRLQHGAAASIDMCCRRRRSAANPPAAVAAVHQRDRRTDGQTDGCPTVT